MIILSPFFCARHPKQLRKLTAENWPRDAEHIVVVSNLYQIKQYPLSAMVFVSFLGIISNTDHHHFCVPNFPKAVNHTSVANQQSSFANTMYTILTVESVPHIDPCAVVKKWRHMLMVLLQCEEDMFCVTASLIIKKIYCVLLPAIFVKKI